VQLLPAGGERPIPLIYAENLAHAVKLALVHGEARPALSDSAPVTVYDLPSDHPVGQRQVLEVFARHLSRDSGRALRPVSLRPVSLRPLSLPVGLAEAGAALLERLGVRTPGAVELPLTRATRFAGRGHPFDSKAIRAELGWTPLISAEEALTRTAVWWANRDSPAAWSAP
jgi:nucleoside-diphosphate-sugar epimerase